MKYEIHKNGYGYLIVQCASNGYQCSLSDYLPTLDSAKRTLEKYIRELEEIKKKQKTEIVYSIEA